MFVLSKNKKNITIFHLKIIILTPVKNSSILHRLVVMVIVDERVWLLFFRTASEEEKALALGLSSAITSGFGNAVIAYSQTRQCYIFSVSFALYHLTYLLHRVY